MSETSLIFKKIPAVMASIGAITKDRKNAQQGYAFRGIDDVLMAFQKPLSQHGLFYVPEVLSAEYSEKPTKNGGVMNYARLQVAFTLYAEDGSNVRGVVVGEASDSADKASNKALSAALKYFMLQTFCVPAEHDDADQETHEHAKQDLRPELLKKIEKRFEEAGKTPDDFIKWAQEKNAANQSEEWLAEILQKMKAKK